MGQKVNELITVKKIETILLVTQAKATQSFSVKEVKIDNQILQVGNVYYNLSSVRSIEVKGNELELEIQ